VGYLGLAALLGFDEASAWTGRLFQKWRRTKDE
jgi:hypothetical protein